MSWLELLLQLLIIVIIDSAVDHLPKQHYKPKDIQFVIIQGEDNLKPNAGGWISAI